MTELQNQNEIVFIQKTVLVGELGNGIHELCKHNGISPSSRIAIFSDDHSILIDTLVGFFKNGSDGIIGGIDRLSDDILTTLTGMDYSIFKQSEDSGFQLLNKSNSANTHHMRLGLFTSGTTGAPKLIFHSWDSLFTFRRHFHVLQHRWLVPFLPGTYAWYQMIMLGFFVHSQTLVIPESIYPEDMIEVAKKQNVDAISSTPTFWRYLLIREKTANLKAIPLRQITLGGEPVDQTLLTILAKTFPAARISHIYASTEMGATIVVHDGMEGFPVHWLEKEPSLERPSLKVLNNILWVRSPYAAEHLQDWYCSEDKVEIRGDRVVIIGRENSDFINVGGSKISASAIVNVILTFPGMIWCRVYGKKSAITGSVVIADVVLDPKYTMPDIEEILIRHCREKQLSEIMIPRIWRFPSSIPISNSLKVNLKSE